MNIEQIKEILAGADKEQYYRYCEIKEWSEDNQYHSPTPAQVTSQNGFEPYIEKHNLADLRIILAQHEEIEQQQARIDELAATVERLREQLSAMAAQHQCGCGHPACNRCRDDADNREVLRATPTPTTGAG